MNSLKKNMIKHNFITNYTEIQDRLENKHGDKKQKMSVLNYLVIITFN